MEKTSKWLRSFLTGKKEKGREKGGAPSTALPATKEKRRWSFRRSMGAAKALNSPEPSVSATCHGLLESEIQQKRHAMTAAVATAEAADAAVAAAQAAAEVVRLTVTANSRTVSAIEEASAIKIQSVFRSYLARKALCALKGLVKLQALVRGQLVRKQATAILKCKHSLVNVQARACAQRIGMIEESQATPQWQKNYRRSLQHPQLRQSYEMNRDEEENVKIVEMDSGKTRSNSKRRSSYSMDQTEGTDQRFSIYNSASRTPSKAEMPSEFSPAPSTLIEMSSGARCGHFEEFSFATGQSSPNLSAVSMPTHASLDCPLYPNYMTNTESSRAKTRSQSAPRQRVDTNERQSCRRRPSVEGRNTPRGIRMQRSSSYVGLAAHSYEYPWSIKLDKSNMSLKGSECDSTSTVLTNTNYCRSLAASELQVHGNIY